MRNTLIYLSLLCLLISCSNKEKSFLDQPSISFPGDLDIDFTFSKFRINDTVINIPVEIGGYKMNRDRALLVKIVPDSTTAKEGLHYKAFNERVVLKADSFRVTIPVTIYNNDPLLISRKVRLYLRLQPNENFAEGIVDKQELSLQISNILLKPKIWDSRYSVFFGLYSEAKHRKILEICDIAEIPDVYDGGSFNYKWDAFGRAVNNYYKVNYPQRDENNNVIEPWM